MEKLDFRSYLTTHAKPIALYGGLFAGLTALLLWRLTSLVPGYNTEEWSWYHAPGTWRGILDFPFNALFTIPVKMLSYVFPNNLGTVRAVAVLLGLGTLILFAVLLQKWHGRHTAIIGTLLFGTSAWFLHVSRFGAPEVLYFGVFALAACGYWMKHSGSTLSVIIALGLTALLLYTPGIVWFVLLGIIWQWKVIDRVFKRHLGTVTAAGLVFLAALVPLGLALYKHHEFVKYWLGLGWDWPAPLEVGRNLLEVPYHLFVHGSPNPVLWLGTAPILDVFTLAMFVLGIFLYLRHTRLARTTLFIAFGVLTSVLMAIGGTASFSILMPFIYLIVAAGASYLLDQWFKVFPRNPIARSIGMVLLYVVVGLACLFQLTHYFVGWPHAQATRDVYTAQKP